jgi:hypothetical protein
MIARSGRCAVVCRVLTIVAALLFTGCGGTALNRSFNDYSEVYADTENRQLLLNLARMANSHPPHILQLGLINATFTFGSTATANVTTSTTEGVAPATASPPFRLLSRLWSWVLGASASVTETPTFSMTPLAGPQFAQGFLTSVPPQVFFTLLEQGEPIDELLRVLVHSVEFTFPGSEKPIVIQNTPNPDRPETWVQFVRLAGILLELQRHQLLQVATTVTPSPAGGPLFESPNLEQALKAAEKGMTLREVSPGKFALTSFAATTSLKVDADAAPLFAELGKHPYFRLESLAQPNITVPPKDITLAIRLRSFFGVLSWVSYEQQAFDALAARPGFLDGLPPTQRHPVLKLTWPEGLPPTPPVISLTYVGKKYTITDAPGHSWNRDVFTLLSYIASQVSLDPKALPVQQLINVR